MKKIIILFLFGATLLLASDSIKVSDAYARATPPNMPNSAAFMNLNNITDKNISLIKASSSLANKVELHTHDMKNGMMKMYEVEEILIKANSNTDLKPGGYHIMLIGLNKSLNEGDLIDLSLEFSNGEIKNLELEVKSIKQGMMKHH
ncbi:hypothetical protein AAX26_00046 [Aliarcobacter thereius]|uniref:Copper chaperone PCu(A)C n=2 Tax=Aliarcobacter thereius TaxID=544718 RepID=A0A5R9H9B3_9BACT|nr:copper chaperone PCu(A)C [Aliarcobacter thereius]OCL88366.1 hypothetical protein AAX26_00046 [Aliarcobacter thereius]OCL95046.1 hypothetical protein AA347_00492 [Aliarcobacter thereius LMG 24486]QBF16962.1 copper chaperone PCu(A)C [Aliarcobacter thereius LMG 24486]TLS72692.1 copper chaperone PCu(A)C [Aliarcobacter thereius]TLS92901.1 copper chaperone PCu(A)C [Aliarcobacter thereius]